MRIQSRVRLSIAHSPAASHATIHEPDQMHRRPKFDRYLREDERLSFLAAFIRDATLVDVTDHPVECCDDNDGKFLELASAGNATCIVSGDKDLLVLNPFGEILNLTPQAFLGVRRA